MAISDHVQALWALLAETDNRIIFSAIFAVFVGYWASLILYRRYLSPISHVPGPWLATTQLYQFYYDYVLEGKFFLEIERLHKVYGPVVRTGPFEIHLADPAHYDTLYSVTTTFTKDPNYYDAFGLPNSHFSVVSNKIHATQRAAMNPFFSRRAVLEQEELVHEKAKKLCNRVADETSRGIPSHVQQAFRAVSMDVISEYGFGKENGYHFLDQPDLGTWWNGLLYGLNRMVLIMQLFPALGQLMQAFMVRMPRKLGKKMNPMVRDMLGCIETSEQMVDKVMKELHSGLEREKTIFHSLIRAGERGEIKGVEVTNKYLADEAFAVLGAAVETAGNVMSMAAYQVIKNPAIYKRLHAELVDAFPNYPDGAMPYQALEKLPYLTAVVKESMRRSFPVIKPLPRLTPPGGVVFDGVFVPEGTTVGISQWFMHRHPDVFPNPDLYDPERWLVSDEMSRFREKFVVPFGRGNRMCLGQNLATCEVYVTLAHFFRQFDDVEAPMTNDWDMSYDGYFTGFHPIAARPFVVVRRGVKAG